MMDSAAGDGGSDQPRQSELKLEIPSESIPRLLELVKANGGTVLLEVSEVNNHLVLTPRLTTPSTLPGLASAIASGSDNLLGPAPLVQKEEKPPKKAGGQQTTIFDCGGSSTSQIETTNGDSATSSISYKKETVRMPVQPLRIQASNGSFTYLGQGQQNKAEVSGTREQIAFLVELINEVFHIDFRILPAVRGRTPRKACDAEQLINAILQQVRTIQLLIDRTFGSEKPSPA